MHWTQGLNEYSDDTSYEVVFPEKISNEKRTKRSMDSQLDSLVKHCQYQGHIQGDPESIIVLDTCDGLRGMIEDAEQELLIEPFKSKIYQKINIRIILKRLDIWSNKDLVPYNDKAGVDLANFQKYKDQHPNHYKCDTVHLMRYVQNKFQAGVG
ncbi:Disintegrin and metalloproteinase domain-containing protein 22 [Exaiptasia diaphana]|nr:Disintegrin and metalloproteinase domain-containing protein 22 [Exaiptasia diaphana]